MTFKKLLIIFLVSASMLIGSANADSNVVTFNFTGSVIYSKPSLNAPIDSLVYGSFSYDLNAPVTTYFSSPPTTYSYYYYSAPNALKINFSGHTITSDSLVFNLQDNSGSNADDSFVLGAGSVKLDGIDDGHLSLALGSLPDPSNALTSSLPPQTLNLALFNNISNFGDLVKDNNTKLQFSIVTLSPVPEPESYALILAGLGLVGLTTRRKNYS